MFRKHNTELKPVQTQMIFNLAVECLEKGDKFNIITALNLLKKIETDGDKAIKCRIGAAKMALINMGEEETLKEMGFGADLNLVRAKL